MRVRGPCKISEPWENPFWEQSMWPGKKERKEKKKNLKNILKSSSFGGRLHFKHFQFWFSPISISLKFEEDPIIDCWDIQPIIFWGHLLGENYVTSKERTKRKNNLRNILKSSSFGGRLHFKHFQFWFSPISLCFKFEEDPISDCWYIQPLIFWGHLP